MADAPRRKHFLLARHEARVLECIARASADAGSCPITSRVSASSRRSDHVLGAPCARTTIRCGCGARTSASWRTGSATRSTARSRGCRKIQRPRYGFYLDHLTDAYSTVALKGLGLGFSPYMLLAVDAPRSSSPATSCSRSTCISRLTCSGAFSLRLRRASGRPRRASFLIALNTAIALGLGLGFSVGDARADRARPDRARDRRRDDRGARGARSSQPAQAGGARARGTRRLGGALAQLAPQRLARRRLGDLVDEARPRAAPCRRRAAPRQCATSSSGVAARPPRSAT